MSDGNDTEKLNCGGGLTLELFTERGDECQDFSRIRHMQRGCSPPATSFEELRSYS